MLNLGVRDGLAVHFCVQNPDDRAQIRVPATLAKAIERPLHVHAACLNRGDTVSHSHP